MGGGVAGCEAARVLAIRGHEPHLFEAGDRLGGNLIPGFSFGIAAINNMLVALACYLAGGLLKRK